MNLQEYRVDRNLTYQQLADFLEMSENKVFRLCKGDRTSTRLIDAHLIIKATKGQVDLVDLLPIREDCV